MSGQRRRTSTRLRAPLGAVPLPAREAPVGRRLGRGRRARASARASAALGLGGLPRVPGAAAGLGRGSGGRCRSGGDRRGRCRRSRGVRAAVPEDGRAGAVAAGAAGAGVPVMSSRRSRRSSRAPRPSVVWSAPGSSTRAHDQLEQQPRCGGAAHLGQAGGDDVGGAAEVGAAEPGGLGDQPLALVLGDVDEAGGGGLGDRVDDDEVAQPAQEVLGEAARVLAGLDDLVDDAEHRAAVAGGERVDHLVEQGVGGVAEQAGREVVGDAAGSGAADQLVEDRQGVAGGAGAGADDAAAARPARSATPSCSHSSLR